MERLLSLAAFNNAVNFVIDKVGGCPRTWGEYRCKDCKECNFDEMRCYCWEVYLANYKTYEHK